MSVSTEVKIYAKPDKVYRAISEEILHLTQNSLQPRFDIALSGGNTPLQLFKILEAEFADLIPWLRIHFWWGDERCVAPTEEQSNFKAANDILFSKIDIPEGNIHRIRGENNPEKEVIRYTHEIEENLNYRGESPVFDCSPLILDSVY